MHSHLTVQRGDEPQPDPELAMTLEPPLVHVLKELRRAELQTAITKVTKVVVQSGDAEAVDSWNLCLDHMRRLLNREITIRRQREGARAHRRRKLTHESYEDALCRAPAEAQRRRVKNTKKLLAQLIGVSTARVREWEAENGK